MMISDIIPDFRAVLEELFTFIPYFECRVNGTFKMQYEDFDTGELLDFDGCEEANKTAQFDDPVYDENWCRFQKLVCRKILDKIPRIDTPDMTENGKIYQLLRELGYDTIGERMCTGYTAYCMANGRYLNELKQLQNALMEMLEQHDIKAEI